MSNYRKRKIQRYSIDPSSKFHQNLEEIAIVEDDNIFQFPFLITDRYNRNVFGYDHRLYHWSREAKGLPNFKAWTFFSNFQNAGRQDATRGSITGGDSVIEYCVLIYQSIYTDILTVNPFLLNRYCSLTVLFW